MMDPERYEASREVPARDSAIDIPRMIGEMIWERNEKVLDYGCGTGVTGTKLILPSVELNDSQLFSVDVSREMVEFAMKTYPNSRVQYAVGNVLNDAFPFNDIEFDKIFAILVLHFVKNYRIALERFHELLKPGGYLAFTVGTNKKMINQKLGNDPKWSEYLKGYDEFIPEWVDETGKVEDHFKSNLEDVGFQIVSFEVQKREFVFPQFEMVVELHLSLNPFLKKIPDHLQSDFKKEHRDFLIQHNLVELRGDAAELKYEVLYVVAKKL